MNFIYILIEIKPGNIPIKTLLAFLPFHNQVNHQFSYFLKVKIILHHHIASSTYIILCKLSFSSADQVQVGRCIYLKGRYSCSWHCGVTGYAFMVSICCGHHFMSQLL